MDTIKNYTIINLWLTQVDVLEALNDLYNKAYVQNKIFKRRFKSKRFQRDYRVNNIDKPHIMRL